MDILKIIEDYRSLDLDQVVNHEKFRQYAIVHHSATIEGSTLTEVETQLLLDEGLTPGNKPLMHTFMTKDHFEALKYVIKLAGNRELLSIALIQEINALVMKNTGNAYETVFGRVDASKGEFRKENVQAGGSYFVNFDKVIPYTNALVDRLKEEMVTDLPITDQLDLSFSAHFDLVSIHPFYDGNGRTSRLLMNYIQRYYNLPLAIVFKEDKSLYFEALQRTRKEEDPGIFKNFMYAQYEKHLLGEISEYQKMINNETLRLKPGKGFSLFF